MNCFNCGKPVPEGQNFCGHCGAPQSADPGLEPSQSRGGEAKDNVSKTWLWILLGCGGLIVISCCLGLVFLFAVSNAVSESAVEVVSALQTTDPELLDDALSSVATLVPEFTPMPTQTYVPTPTAQFNCEGLGLTAAPMLQVEMICEQQPAQTDNDFMSMPEYTRVQLTNYPVSPTFHEAQVSVFPVETYRDLNSEAADRIDQLQMLLMSKPERAEEPLPFLPVWNAGQMITAHFEYLEFPDGSGIRYLSQYGQAAWPINNEDLFYTFQGLTADGAYYISAVLPVTHPDLPTNGDEYLSGDFEAFIESYASYLEEIEQQLDGSASKSYQPGLALLDAVMRTLVVR